MTKEQYLKALKRLGLTPAGKRTAEMLGLSVRQLIRINVGDSSVTPTIALLLKMYLHHGIPKD